MPASEHQMESGITLFTFSKVKSEQILRVSDYNIFNYNFTENEPNNTEYHAIKTPKALNSSYYIKKANIDIPSNEKFKEETFKTSFSLNYETSFANFGGVSEKMFTEMFEKNQFIPKVNQMGDIEVDISNIIQNLKNFNEFKLRRIRRKFKNHSKKRKSRNKNTNVAHNKQNNIFKVTEIDSSFSKDSIIPLNENELYQNDIAISSSNIEKNFKKNKNKNKKISSNSISLNQSDSKDSKDKKHDKTLLNIKVKLKNISIKNQKEESNKFVIKNEPKNESNISLENKNILPNNLVLSNENLFKSKVQHDIEFSSNSNKNNVFSFSSKAIQNFSNNSLKNESQNFPIFTSLNINDSNNNILDKYNFQSFQNRAFLSPNAFAPSKFESLLSPNISVNSPFNINIFNDAFTFKNKNGNNDDN